jgi:hypothetical protein
MAKRGSGIWVNDIRVHPRIEGSLEISRNRYGVFVGGDPAALRSLAELLIWIADTDQDSLPLQPDGERFHVHLHARDAPGFNSLTPFSCETEICRLDAKGTGEFPERYRKARGNARRPALAKVTRATRKGTARRRERIGSVGKKRR